MKRVLPQLLLAAGVAAALLLPNAGIANAATPRIEGATATIVDDDGVSFDDTIGGPDEVDFTATGDPAPGTVQPLSCPEAHNPATYSVKGAKHFIAANDPPQSSWLKPGQSVAWTITHAHTFTASITVGAEADMSFILAKSKLKIDVTISKSWTWSGSQTVTDVNKGKTSYRAVLGNVGWKITTVKSWVAAPCTPKKKTIIVIVAHKGDLSIGHSSK
jgi:hypothetical protein